jgi:hypothetical protein
MKIVHVTSDAKASPIMTALTNISADRNIDHGDNSCSTGTIDFNDFDALSVSAGAAAGTAGETEGTAGTCATGLVAAGTAEGAGCGKDWLAAGASCCACAA